MNTIWVSNTKKTARNVIIAIILPLAFSNTAYAGLYDYELFATDGSSIAGGRINGYAVNVQLFRAGEGGNRNSTNYTSGDFCGKILEYSDYGREWWNNWTGAGYGIILRFQRDSTVCRLK